MCVCVWVGGWVGGGGAGQALTLNFEDEHSVTRRSMTT